MSVRAAFFIGSAVKLGRALIQRTRVRYKTPDNSVMQGPAAAECACLRYSKGEKNFKRSSPNMTIIIKKKKSIHRLTWCKQRCYTIK